MNTGLQLGPYNVHSRMIQREENRWGFREALKLEKVDCWWTERGSLFQKTEPETEKARGPNVLSLVSGAPRMRWSEAEQRV